jgi:hypothetical protein
MGPVDVAILVLVGLHAVATRAVTRRRVVVDRRRLALAGRVDPGPATPDGEATMWLRGDKAVPTSGSRISQRSHDQPAGGKSRLCGRDLDELLAKLEA